MTPRLLKQGYPVSFLDTQYTISPSIVLYPSQKYYGNKFKSGVEASHLPQIEGFPWPNSDVSVSIVHVDHQEEVRQYSLQNTK